MLQNAPDVRHEIQHFHGSKDRVMRDMCDGSIYKSHSIFREDEHALQIIAYYDEIELCNPLGSSTKKHKLGYLFFSLGNISPQYRSQLKTIFVAAIGSNMVIRRHGLNLFFKPFVDSIEALSTNGLTVSVEGEVCVFKVAILADTLAAHAIGGFKESMSFAKRICRTCMATTEQIQVDFKEEKYELRTPDKHKQQVTEISEDPSKSVNYGINSSSVLDSITNFSVVTNIPHDVMHDLLEGVLPYEMKLLFTHLVSEKYVTIGINNDRLKRFDLGCTESSDILSPIDEKILKTD